MTKNVLMIKLVLILSRLPLYLLTHKLVFFMKNIYLFLLVIIGLSVSSCITNKQLTYLQEKNRKHQDSMLVSIKKMKEPYRLQVNDLISVRIKAIDQETVGIFNPINDSNPNATGEERLYYDGFVVDPHGNIRIPSIGEMAVLGLTVDEVREKIEQKLLEDYFKEEANIFVTVKLAGIRYTINGEIRSPGSKIIYRDAATIMEAIANSGDITLTGDRKDVVIIRQYPLGQKVHHIDLTTIDAMNSEYYYIKPNDLILINPLPQKTLGLGTNGLQTFTAILSVLTAVATTVLLFTRL